MMMLMGGMGGMGMGGVGMGGYGGFSPIPSGYGPPTGHGPGLAPAPGYGTGSIPGNVWPGMSGGYGPGAPPVATKPYGHGFVDNRKWLLHELVGATNIPGESKKEPESSGCKAGYSIFPNSTNCCDNNTRLRCCHTPGEPDTEFCS